MAYSKILRRLRSEKTNYRKRKSMLMGKQNFISVNITNENTQVHLQLLREMNDIESMFLKDKAFVVQRRGGGHGPSVIPNPEDWYTPRWNYINTNMLSQLPVRLSENENVDSIVTVNVYDDLMDETNPVKGITVHVLLSDSSDGDISEDDCLERVTIATMAHKDGRLYNNP